MTSISLRPVLERLLRAAVAGDVLFDRFSRGRYATDASHYQIESLGIVVPRSAEDLATVVAIAREEGVSVTARGGGTCAAGPLGEGHSRARKTGGRKTFRRAVQR